ncbi:restriction endonuclease subunit S [Mycoplasmopsis felis]|uniref:restriction endonuclease subunit S n=1 Tax=Mycoplasmopsis felis TaxID=33923 RepID=UPI002B001BD7|nr:restriction endonuclease subunit S [Mycoplasmopsis felis]WQQ10976.1 restriction endonuclease subunit S [Mycoplasmopsis felis]
MKKVLFPRVRFKGFDDNWEQGNIGEVFELTRGEVLSQRKIRNKKMGEYIYPVFSSQTLNNGLLGFYNNFLFKNSITWTTDGANAGTVLYRDGLFYATNVCGVMLQKTSIKPSSYFAHEINVKVKKHVIKAGNPKLMINVLHEVLINFSKNKLEQEKISILIENIDNLISLEEIKLNKLKQLKETLLQKMFPEGNSKTPRIRFKGFEGEWKEEKLDDIFKVITGGEPPKNYKNSKHPVGKYKYPIYSNGQEANAIWGFSDNYSINTEAITISSIGTIGFPVVRKMFFTPIIRLKTLLPYNKNMNINFLNLSVSQINFSFNQAGIPSMNSNQLKDNIILISRNFSEQQKIGDFFSKIDTLINFYNSKLNKLKQIKEALLQKMFV